MELLEIFTRLRTDNGVKAVVIRGLKVLRVAQVVEGLFFAWPPRRLPHFLGIVWRTPGSEPDPRRGSDPGVEDHFLAM